MNGPSTQRPLYSPLLAMAIVAGLVLVYLSGVVGSGGDAATVRRWQDTFAWIAAIIGVSGAISAMLAFSRGDYLRRVWAVFSAGALLLLVGTALTSFETNFAPERPFLQSPLLPIRLGIVIAANGCTIAGMVLLVLTYRRSGMQPEPNWRATLLWLVAGGAAVAICVPPLLLAFRRIGDGPPQSWGALMMIASTLGDFTTVLLVAPILRVAYMLRGGKLAWAWWALALSGAFWLVYDSREWLSQALPGEPGHNLQLVMVARFAGLALFGLAGWLLRVAVISARVSSLSRPAASVASP